MKEHAGINKDLFTQMADGDEQAYRTLFHFFTPRLQAFVFSIVKSEGPAEEIVQDVMMKLWIHRSQVAEKDNPASWVFTVASNQALTFLRRIAIERKIIDKVKTQLLEIQDNNPTERQVLQRDNDSLLQKAISQLTPQQQMIYKMSRLEGLTHKEIAGKLGLSQNTVKNHMVSAAKTVLDFIRKSLRSFFSFFF